MTSNRKKILVTLDDSGRGQFTLRYLSRLLKPGAVDLVLFSVLTKMPERFWDMEETPSAEYERVAADRWKNQQTKVMEQYMTDAVKLLAERGFPPDTVKVKLQERNAGIARDIIQEARNGYDAVVAGRQGMNPITRLVIGSVASKLIQSLTDTPFWLVGGGVKNNRILLSMDASGGAMRAVAHVGDMVGGTDAEVTLFHVMRSVYPNPSIGTEEGKGSGELEVPVVESREETAIRDAFEKASGMLQQAGVQADRITSKLMKGVATRSGSIATQAMVGGYSTIVMGRRGHSKVGEFYMGRVTNKVIQLASDAAVWIVS